MQELSHLVRCFQKEPASHGELAYYRSLRPFSKLIHEAAFSVREDGKRYSHQRRIRRVALVKACRTLLRLEMDIKRCRDFESLHDLIEESIGWIKGIGDLYIYDVALRLGAKLVLYPQKVYLHAGTRIGAKRLGLNYKKDVLDISELPEPLRKLKPYQIEDFLCIFKNEFINMRKRIAYPIQSCGIRVERNCCGQSYYGKSGN